MLDNDCRKYRDFFEKIKKFQKKQQMQKQRGLNDYNILTTVLKPHDEVRLHSRMIASFLDIYGTHYQDSLFLEIFLEILDLKGFGIDLKNTTVSNEFANIDIYIRDGSKHIIIENKIYAVDQSEQIKRYIQEIYKRFPRVQSEDIVVIYLSIDRNSPEQYSLGDLKIENNKIVNSLNEEVAIYRNMHYKSKLLDWLSKCKYEVQNITNLNMAFENYKDVVEKITNQYKGKVMSLKDELLNNDECFDLAKDISKAFQEAQAERNIQLKKEKINLIINLLENQNIKNYCPKWCAIDIIANYTIRIIADDNNYLIQVFDKDGYGREFDQKEKQPILNKLQIIDKRFKSVYSQVYGQMEYDYDDTKLDSIKSLITELINLG